MQTNTLRMPALPQRTRFSRAVLFAGVTVIAADWLFFDRSVGISALLFIAVVATAVLANRPGHVALPRICLASGVLFLSVLPIIEQATVLSLLSGAFGIAAFTILIVGGTPTSLTKFGWSITRLLTSGPFQFIRAARQVRLAGKRFRCRHSMLGAILPWTIPICIGTVFLMLFRSANPVIEEWMDSLTPDLSTDGFEAARIGFWGLALVITWPFMRPKQPPGFLPNGLPIKDEDTDGSWLDAGQAEALFGTRSTIRALTLFNALFLLQTALDVTYLWGGAALPAGMSYAEYAHRGAYPLVATALLAAAVILIAMRPGSPTEAHPTVRRLVFLWTAQNVMLVTSSILRLQLYVAEYALTYLRVAAFVWMGLVASGLVLIVVRVVLKRSNGWLVSANMLTLTATLYLCAFVNFPYFIAAHNLTHAIRAPNGPASADITYICSLGPHAYPAIDEFVPVHTGERLRYIACMGKHLTAFLAEAEDWRCWGFRNHRLLNFLESPQRPNL